MKRGRWICVAAVVLVSTAIVHALSGGTDLTFDSGSGVDDTVCAIAVQADGKSIVGGNFSTVRGLVRNRIARVNADGSGDASFNPGSGASGQVYAVALQSDGKAIVGGLFTSFNGDTSHANVLRLNTDGSIDGTFTTNTGSGGAVYAIAVQSDGKVVIGGSFTSVNGTGRNRIARLTDTGSLDTGFDPGTGVGTVGFPIPNAPRVNSVAVQPADGKVVIGGEFSEVNGTNRYFLARLNANGSLDSGFGSPGVYPGFSLYYVSNVALQPDGKVLAAGLFPTTAGERTIARLSGTDGALDSNFANPVTSSFAGANALAVQSSDNKILIGGSFSAVTVNATTTARRQIARLNTDGTLDLTFDLLPGQPAFPTVYVKAIGLQADGKVVIGGEFSAPVVTGRSRLERLSTSGVVDVTFTGDTGVNSDIYSMALQSNGKVAIGGFFTTVNGLSRNRVAQLNADGTLDSAFNPGTGATNAVFAVATQTDNKVIVGGSFLQVNGVGRPRLARLNADGGVDTDFCSNPAGTRCGVPGSGPNDQITAITVQPDGKILIGGYFGDYGGTARSKIARLNTNGTLDAGFNPGGGASALVSPTVYSIAEQTDTKVLIAGSFTSFDGQIRNHVARLNSNGSLDTLFVPNTGTAGAVLDFYAVVAQPDGKVIVGGAFFPLQGMTPARIARLNSDGSIDSSFGGTGANGNVRSVVLQPDGRIVIVGEFTQVNGVERNRVARLNSNGSLDTGFNPNPGANNQITTVLRQPDGRLLIGGYFTSINGAARWHVARLDASACPFTDDPLVLGQTTIRAAHVTELRACIDGVRTAHSLTPFTYSHPSIVPGTTVVTAIDITEMRTALEQAYTAAAQPPPTYTHPSIAAGMIVTAVDISELRTAVLAAP
jgi:uncharacterized delta-60 repeat protein